MAKRLGKPLPKAKVADAKIQPDDVDEARKAWRRDAPSPYKRLLDAKEQAPRRDG